MNGICEHVGCSNPAKWHFRGQWESCDVHVDDGEKLLRDNVDETITRERIFNQVPHD